MPFIAEVSASSLTPHAPMNLGECTDDGDCAPRNAARCTTTPDVAPRNAALCTTDTRREHLSRVPNGTAGGFSRHPPVHLAGLLGAQAWATVQQVVFLGMQTLVVVQRLAFLGISGVGQVRPAR